MNPQIQHLVISGGGINAFINFAILRASHEDGYWNIENIQSMYGTSSGGLIALMICLKYDWPTLDNYLLKRPWQHVFPVNWQIIMTAFTQRGFFEYKHIQDAFLPLFKGKDISPDITLQEFYEWTGGIDLHFFSTEINEGLSQDVDLSHSTHPDWKVLEALYCSMCLPILFQPYLKDSQCFVDGGSFLNYPILPCILAKGESAIPHIWGLKRSSVEAMNSEHYLIDSGKNLLDTTFIFMHKIMERIVHNHVSLSAPIREIVVPCSSLSLSEIFHIFENEQARHELMKKGHELWQFYKQNNFT